MMAEEFAMRVASAMESTLRNEMDVSFMYYGTKYVVRYKDAEEFAIKVANDLPLTPSKERV